jgi:ABC-type nitrate/sulfonate/bicarbonate transport system ATPase subunit
MADSPIAVTLSAVAQRFGDLDVLGPIDFAVEQGAFVALVGPSGSGKSSLLRLIAGLAAPWMGEIRAQGRIGVAFQQPALFPWLDVAANVRFALDEAGVPRAEADRRVADWLAAVELSEFAAAHPATLSGGMAQRAALARALAPEPDLLLLDEPFAALDSLTRKEMQALLERVRHRTDATVILVTHDVEEAVYLADRVAVLSPRPGRVVAEVPVGLAHPRDADVRLSEAFLDIRREVETALGAGRS